MSWSVLEISESISALRAGKGNENSPENRERTGKGDAIASSTATD